MSTIEENPVEQNDDDLDLFSVEFFGQNKTTEEPASSQKEAVDTDDASDANDEKDETHVSEDDSLAESNDEDEESVEEDSEDVEETKTEEKPKKKNRFQERIDELTGKHREAERAKQALEERIEQLMAKLEQNESPKQTQNKAEDTGPTPEDLNEDGSEKYPLGEYDPQYVRDLTRFTIKQEQLAIKARENAEAEQRAMDEQRAALHASWQEKLNPAQERYPDFQDKGQNLLGTFESIDQAYGEYLTSTIMSLDYGPDVLYYLANNIDEAKKIVASGPTKATIALGRIDAKFMLSDEEKQKARPKISQAPTPPKHLNKGSAVSKSVVDDDTDDLDAFAAKLFKGGRRT